VTRRVDIPSKPDACSSALSEAIRTQYDSLRLARCPCALCCAVSGSSYWRNVATVAASGAGMSVVTRVPVHVRGSRARQRSSRRDVAGMLLNPQIEMGYRRGASVANLHPRPKSVT
jgi:hypothetical protein